MIRLLVAEATQVGIHSICLVRGQEVLLRRARMPYLPLDITDPLVLSRKANPNEYEMQICEAFGTACSILLSYSSFHGLKTTHHRQKDNRRNSIRQLYHNISKNPLQSIPKAVKTHRQILRNRKLLILPRTTNIRQRGQNQR